MADMDASLYLDPITAAIRDVLEDHITGIYLHGSMAMRCFHPERSDIDLLVAVDDKLSFQTYRQLADRIIKVEEGLPNTGGIELSVMLEADLKRMVHPMPFEFHYSPLHKARYEAGPAYLCGGGADPDLAAHLTVAYERGMTLFGRPLRAYEPPDKRHYIDAIVSDVKDAPAEIAGHPVYYTLNLCRVLYFIKEGVVASKKEGGEWGIAALPAAYRGLVRQCLRQYEGLAPGRIDADERLLTGFANEMLAEIRRSMTEVNLNHFR